VTVRFLADEDIRSGIVLGLRSFEPAIDILDAKSSGLRGTSDSALLELAAQQDRILITHDCNTMPGYLQQRLAAGKSSPGVIVIPQRGVAIGEIIDLLLLIWAASDPAEWVNRVEYLPW